MQWRSLLLSYESGKICLDSMVSLRRNRQPLAAVWTRNRGVLAGMPRVLMHRQWMIVQAKPLQRSDHHCESPADSCRFRVCVFQNFFVRVDGFEFEWEAGSPGSLTLLRELFCFRAL